MPFSGDLPDSEIKPGSPTVQADCLSSEPPGQPVHTIHIHMSLCTCVHAHMFTLHLGVFFLGFLIQEFFNLPCCETDPLSSEL